MAGCFHATNNVDWHTHPVDELVLITAGQSVVRCGEHSLSARAGSLLVLPAGEAQYQETRGMTRALYVQYTSPPKILESSARVITVPLGGHLRRWIEDVVALYLAATEVSEAVTAGLLVAVLEECNRLEAHRTKSATIHPAVQRAVAFVEAHFAAPLTVEAMADEAGVSASHLTALFRAAIGMPPLRYQQEIRLRTACKLLRDPYLSVKQVARQCGYDDVNYFTRIFRQRNAQPPKEWRKMSGT